MGLETVELDELVRKAYPKMLYHRTDGTMTVKNKEEEATFTSQGWRQQYLHQEFPRMMYHPWIKAKIVKTKAEMEALPAPWQKEPIIQEAKPAEDVELTEKHVAYLLAHRILVNSVDEAYSYYTDLAPDMQKQFLETVATWQGHLPVELHAETTQRRGPGRPRNS